MHRLIGHACVLRVMGGRRRHGGYSTVFAAAFDALVGILVQRGKVFPKLFVCYRYVVTGSNGGEFLSEVTECCSVELVLV
jgi:hypothetical protein